MAATNITWTATKDAPNIGGRTFTGGKVVTHAGEKVVDFGSVIVDGKDRRLMVRIAGKPDLQAAVEAAEEADRQAKRAATEQLAKNVPGLKELRTAIDAEVEYRDRFREMMEDGDNDGVNPPRSPETNVGELQAQYPRAALYLRAEGYTRASHWAKAKAGREAMAILADGRATEEAKSKLDNWLKDNDVYVD